MESALYGIYALVVFVSEISLVRCAHSFDFWYVNNSCVNTVRPHFPWSILYLYNTRLEMRLTRLLPTLVKFFHQGGHHNSEANTETKVCGV